MLRRLRGRGGRHHSRRHDRAARLLRARLDAVPRLIRPSPTGRRGRARSPRRASPIPRTAPAGCAAAAPGSPASTSSRTTPPARCRPRGVPPLAGAPVAFARDGAGADGFAWDAGQVSVCFPGYPQPWEGESEAAFRFRRDRDAAHVDGLMRFDGRRRRLGEPHGFILGLPLDDAPTPRPRRWSSGRARTRSCAQAFRDRFAGLPPDAWAAEDITDAYVAARRAAFERCRAGAGPRPAGRGLSRAPAGAARRRAMGGVRLGAAADDRLLPARPVSRHRARLVARAALTAQLRRISRSPRNEVSLSRSRKLMPSSADLRAGPDAPPPPGRRRRRSARP